MYLVIVDTAQIQPYIVGSNRLRENIGASHLVAQATGEWALRAVPKPNNVKSDLTLDDDLCIEDGKAGLAAEVLYAGGGNCAILFRNKEAAADFTRRLSRQALVEALGLQLVIGGACFDWNAQSLVASLSGAREQLAREKRRRAVSSPLLGLGVTRKCASTELPATDETKKFSRDASTVYPASAEIHGKLAVVRPQGRAADERLRKQIRPPHGYDYPSEFDEMGRSHGQHSYIAVVHADGDGMGQRFQKVGDNCKRPEDNRQFIRGLRALSKAINDAALAALKQVLDLMVLRLEAARGGRKVAFSDRALAELPLQFTDEGGLYLPFRPVVFGGDDVTFVCDGRLGLALALAYLRRFEKETEARSACQGRATACAGVAIVKAHYPFARAYALAEDLCKQAKALRREVAEGNDDRGRSCIDWHFALGGLAGDVEEVRRREYKVVGQGDLNLRPVTLRDNPSLGHRAWDVIARGVSAFRGPGWAGRRNKVKALREALREGPDVVNQFLAQFNDAKQLPEVEPSLRDWPRRGWQQGVCGYFDAIELSDWFISLEEKDVP